MQELRILNIYIYIYMYIMYMYIYIYTWIYITLWFPIYSPVDIASKPIHWHWRLRRHSSALPRTVLPYLSLKAPMKGWRKKPIDGLITLSPKIRGTCFRLHWSSGEHVLACFYHSSSPQLCHALGSLGHVSLREEPSKWRSKTWAPDGKHQLLEYTKLRISK